MPEDLGYAQDVVGPFNILVDSEEGWSTFTYSECNYKRGNFPVVDFGIALPV